jgi:outer membrane immunogenic protein
MKMLVLAGAFLLGGSGFAFATEAKKTPMESFDWSGAYAGVHLGYGWGDSRFTDAEYNGFPPFFPTVIWDVGSDGFLGGIQAGYNVQTGSVVLSVEGELGYLGLKGGKLQPGTDPFDVPYDASGTIDKDWYGGISARLGYAWERTLFYLEGGAVYSAANLGFIDTCVTAPCGDTMIEAYKSAGWGYQLGGGVEYAVARNWTIKAEYVYFDFGSHMITGTGVGGSFEGMVFNIHSNLSVHTAKAGLNYKF